jgi:hypothetical protein
MLMKSTRVILAMTATAGIGFGATAASGLVVGPSDGSQPTVFLTPTKAVATIQTDIASAFPLFDETAAASRMPASVVAQVGSSLRYGRNAALARPVDTPNGTGWVIPGDGYLCLAVPDPVNGYGSTCLPTAVAATRGLWLRLGGARADGKVVDTVVVPRSMEAVETTPAQTGKVPLTRTGDGVASGVVDASGDPSVVPSS